MVWKSSGEGDEFSSGPPRSLPFSPHLFLSSWKVCDTLLELIRAEWGKRWGETAEITSTLSRPLPLPVAVPVLPDSLCGFFFWGGSGLDSSKSRGWWNNSLIQWSDNEKKERLQWRMIKAQYHVFFSFQSFFYCPDGGGSCQVTSSFIGRSTSNSSEDWPPPTKPSPLFPMQQ